MPAQAQLGRLTPAERRGAARRLGLEPEDNQIPGKPIELNDEMKQMKARWADKKRSR